MDEKNKAAANLKSAERVASEKIPEQAEDSLDGARENEEDARGFYSGKGKSGLFKKDDEKKSGKAKVKKALKGKGPLGIILGMLFGVGGMMMGMQTMLPVAIEEMITEKLNSIGVSSTIASDAWLDTQLNFGIREGDIDENNDASLFGLSPWQVQSLERQGLKALAVTVNGRSVSAILYENDNDDWIPVVGSSYLNDTSYDEGALISALASASGYSNIGRPVSVSTAFLDSDFKIAYTTASKTWRGGSSGWFDNIMDDITETKLSIDRNRWARYTKKALDGASSTFKRIAKNNKKVSDGGFDSVRERDKLNDYQWDDEVPVLDENGNPIMENGTPKTEIEVEPVETVDYESDGGVKSINTSDAVMSESAAYANAQAILKSKAFKTAGAVSSGLSFLCTVAEAFMSIYTIASAYQTAQFLNQITGFLEASSKLKAGKGDNSPYHEEAETLTTRVDTVYANTGEVVRKDKTAMESAGMSWLFNNSEVNPSDASVLNVNFEAVMSNVGKLTSNISLTASTFEGCGYIKVADAGIDLTTTVLSFIPGPGQVIKLTQVVYKLAKKLVVTALVAAALEIAIPQITRGIANYIVRDVATEWFGEDLGNVVASAANKYLGGNAMSGLQGPGSENAVMAYLGERDAVIAEEAEYQRAIRDPLDITSPYTFLGSIAYSLIPMAFSGGGIMSALRQVSSLTTSALTGLLPTAGAISRNAALTSKGTCSLLESVGAVGDAFCNPYVITDASTLRTSPVAVNEIVHGNGDNVVASLDMVAKGVSSDNFNSDGSIAEDSELAKYITYCGQRTSPFGVRDAAIASQISGGTVTGLLGYTPALGNAVDIITNLQEQKNIDFVRGTACIVSEDNEKWGTYRWYQRYAENMRLVENMNPGYVSPVTAFLEKHYEENPVDDSLEGTLARFSGMSKEKVEDTLALIEYYQFLAEYDGSERYAFGGSEVEAPTNNWYDNETYVAENYYIIPNFIVYADVRNRQTYTV